MELNIKSVDEEGILSRNLKESMRLVRAYRFFRIFVASELKGRKPYWQVEPFRVCCVSV